MVIRAQDRIAEVLKRDDRLMEVFAAAAPAFRGLRNPVTRKVMGRLVTVEQAARVAGVDPEALVDRLNQVLVGEAADPKRAENEPEPEPTPPLSNRDAPAALAAIPAERVTDLDVRDALRRGEEPFHTIMEARRGLPPGGVLRLRATFEPVPLYAALGKQGMDHWTERLAEDDWRVWFYPVEAGARAVAAPATPRPTPEAPSADRDDDIVILDVRGMEPPEPMVRTLAVLETLPPGKTLLQINERIPRFLLPKLEENGFVYEIREQQEGVVRVFIRRPSA